jgi:peptidoglycan-N-acetylglucosamine deacetylase
MEQVNALAVDLEDWYHPELVRTRVKGPVEPQAAEATQPILDLLDRFGVKATFFVLGDVAEQSPGLIRTIYEKGHEIGCHGFSHRPLWELDDVLFRSEIERFNQVVKKIIGPEKVKGFRAPTFSLDNRSKWVLRILADYGFQYDASVFPVKLNRLYGIAGAPTRPYRVSFEDIRVEDPRSPLIEFPMSLWEMGGMKIPMTGGFYLRVIPFFLLRMGMKRINKDSPFFLYIHPWETFEKTPRLRLPMFSSFITYYGLDRALCKLESLLRTFRFARVDQVLELSGI